MNNIEVIIPVLIAIIGWILSVERRITKLQTVAGDVSAMKASLNNVDQGIQSLLRALGHKAKL